MIGWNFIATFLRNGLVKPRFKLPEKEQFYAQSAKQEATDTDSQKYQLKSIVASPLTPIKLTVSRQNIFINSFAQEHQALASLIVQNLQILTFHDLLKNLELCCNTLIRQLEGAPYTVGVIEQKSQEWIANLAYRFLPLEHLPQQAVKLGKLKTQGLLEVLNLDFKQLAEMNGNLVIFDDVSYTGKQIKDYLSMIHQYFNKANGKTVALEEPRTQLNIYLVIPFVSKKAKANLSSVISNYNTTYSNPTLTHRLSIKLICQVELKNVEDISVTSGQAELEKLYHLLEFPNIAPTTKAISIDDDRFEVQEIQEKVLCFTAWKKADGISLPKLLTTQDIAKGFLKDQLTQLPALIDPVKCPYKG